MPPAPCPAALPAGPPAYTAAGPTTPLPVRRAAAEAAVAGEKKATCGAEDAEEAGLEV